MFFTENLLLGFSEGFWLLEHLVGDVALRLQLCKGSWVLVRLLCLLSFSHNL